MVMIIYIAKLILTSGIFFSYYWLFLRNQQFHRYNRFYMLITSCLSMIIPFIKIPLDIFNSQSNNTVLIKTLRVIAVSEWEDPVIVYANRNSWSHWINLQNGFTLLYILGLLICTFLLTRTLLYVLGLKRKFPVEYIQDVHFYNTDEKGTPFSFFRSIFWNVEIPFNTKEGQQIFQHELYHVKEKHSADVLLMELLCCIAWFNPFFHLIKREIKAIHEFLADEFAVSSTNRHEYAELLVLHAMQQKKPGITNQFFHNQIKRRITMIIHSNLVRRGGYISRIMALPLLFLLVSAFAVKLTNTSKNNFIMGKNALPVTVIIDAGHGGADPGSISNDGRLQEKNIALSISQVIKKLSASYNINVVLTRDKDELPGNASTKEDGLKNRIEIAKEKNADLFISIHVNAEYNKDVQINKNSMRTGFEVFVSAKQDNSKSKLLASSILTGLKNLYTVSDQIKQRENTIIVLDNNTCPSIVLECGYINNEKDVAFITNADNQEKVAKNILEGIVKYSNTSTGNNSTTKNDTIINTRLVEGKKSTTDTIIDVKLFSTDEVAGEKTIKPGPNREWNADSNFPLNADKNISEQNHFAFHQDTLKNKNIIYTKVEIEPDFPGGRNGWVAYLQTHLKYPQKAQDKEIQGTVLIQFIIDKNGNTSDVKAISGPKELREESVRVIKESGKWIPAVEKGQKVNAYKRQPITYKLSVS